ncbi:sulfurtransferase [Candidatus Kaiserbacteria bacterium CG10_big_fil_rev_8_21_14_0_10_44_10]|uniref:Sulfurtransferase n=1 Tax=Candidatus Kaiserbacteria bacterium CG10_big_fil_rev_8_21_14_0_10_44_10 TaxID=1974606 RepID=A0A2H0UGX2_9BACT|nr:MAG: sulfurtransferase [Candidatus Kaiserbacteria bacterium CG10_big_fil_rev_8_21_14_0_10_44_10]
MKHISISGFKEVIESESNNQTVDFINVCTPAEYKEKHIKGVRSVPLDTLHTKVDELNKKKTVYIHCRSGNRGRQAIEKLQALGVTAELVNVEGGLMAWEEAGFETGSHTKRIPIIRQVFIGAGALIIIGLLLTHLVNYNFLLIPFFVSIGLLVSGITGWCGAAIILSKMPWNNK